MNDWQQVRVRPGGRPCVRPAPAAPAPPRPSTAPAAPDATPAVPDRGAVLPRPDLHVCAGCAGTGQVWSAAWGGQLVGVTGATVLPTPPLRSQPCTPCRGLGWVVAGDGLAPAGPHPAPWRPPVPSWPGLPAVPVPAGPPWLIT